LQRRPGQLQSRCRPQSQRRLRQRQTRCRPKPPLLPPLWLAPRLWQRDCKQQGLEWRLQELLGRTSRPLPRPPRAPPARILTSGGPGEAAAGARWTCPCRPPRERQPLRRHCPGEASLRGEGGKPPGARRKRLLCRSRSKLSTGGAGSPSAAQWRGSSCSSTLLQRLRRQMRRLPGLARGSSLGPRPRPSLRALSAEQTRQWPTRLASEARDESLPARHCQVFKLWHELV